MEIYNIRPKTAINELTAIDETEQSNIGPVPGEELALLHPARTVTNKELAPMAIEPASKRTFSIQHMPNGGTLICCSFIAAGDSVITLEIAGDEGNPTGRRWYDRVKSSVEYAIQNWWLLVFILDRLCGT